MAPRPEPVEVAARLGGDLDEALEQLQLPAHIVDRRGRFRWQNASSIGLLGDRRNQPFVNVVAPEARQLTVVEFTKKVLGSARTTDFDTVALLPDGGRLPVSVHSVAIGERGHVAGVFAIVTPVSERASAHAPTRLTPRQHEMLLLLGRGLSTAEIAAALGISTETVRNHVRALLNALGAHSRLEAVAEGRRRGLLP
jgi:DNA-binding CsgD family transcriptional regulator